MSFKLHRRFYERQFGSASRKAVALKLADVANDDGTNVFPSIAFVASQSELSDSTVGRHIRSFRNEGLLVLVSPAGSGKYRTNEYLLDLEKIKSLPMCPRPQHHGDSASSSANPDHDAANPEQSIGQHQKTNRTAHQLPDGTWKIFKGTKPFEAWLRYAIKISDGSAEGECHYCPEDGSIIRTNLWPRG